MKRFIVVAVLALSLVVVASASAQTRSCRVPGDVVARSLRAVNVFCRTAQALVADEWNGAAVGHWDFPGGRNGGAWRVTWRVDDSQAMPTTWYRAVQGRAVVTWEQGT